MVMEGGRCEGEEGDEEGRPEAGEEKISHPISFSQPRTPVYIK